MNNRFHQLHFGKPLGNIHSIVSDIKEVLEITGIHTGVFEFNGKEVYVNIETELDWCGIVINRVIDPESKKIVDIRG